MKRLVICLDGTWNNAGAGSRSVVTNIVKLHRAIAPVGADGIRQISHYVEGIASENGERASFLKGAVGYGVSAQISKAYRKLCNDYEPGDEVYLFGFSRGAFQARSLAGLIALVGIAHRYQPFYIDEAWALYRQPEGKRDPEKLQSLRARAHYPARIKCIGVWDTVGNLGNPFFTGTLSRRETGFHDTRFPDIADIGLHALSIDEIRGPFRPLLWTLPEGQTLRADRHVEQVWFPGTHADVGGGWVESGLSDLSLEWMVERVAEAKSGLAFDAKVLKDTLRPDPFAPQHRVSTGKIFYWSGILPFLRLIQQRQDGVPAWRQMLFGLWRTGKLAKGQSTINETVHPSAVRRFGQKVVELKHGRSRIVEYEPANLAPLIPSLPDPMTQPAKVAEPGQPRRIKVFTVHGTFAYETTWDDWDAKDDAARPADERAFINRLSAGLKEKGVTLNSEDHSQYNWSGGNSHDERRTAAIGLKKHIENVLLEDRAKNGKDVYDGVYVVSHSHGGTISRMAMNLWDKAYDYYDPQKTATFDEFKHDDSCAVCKRSRNGMVGRNTIPRPDGVITFGSPFVTFERRTAGLVTARLGAWVFRAFALAFFAAAIFAAYSSPSTLASAGSFGLIQTPLVIGWPILLYWLFASLLPRAILRHLEWVHGKGQVLYIANAILQGVKYALVVLLAVYFAAYAVGWWHGTGGWENVKAWLPFVANETLLLGLAWATLIGLAWGTVITAPGRFLRWLKHTVAPLGRKLPQKYDPSEDKVVTYLSYHAPGDEAGLGLRFFGALTWLIQTFGLAAACMLALGVLLVPYIAIEAILHLATGKGLLSPLGISAFSTDMSQRDNFIVLMDWLTYLPRTVLPQFGFTGFETLGNAANPRDVAWWVPVSIVLTLFIVFLLLMPIMLILLGIAYLVAMWLRRSGLVFGGESMAWNLANRIAVSRRPNANTAMRVFFFTPEAWWRKEIAHCYYYKNDRVISDVANSIANWSSIGTAPVLPIGRWVSGSARALIVSVAMLSIFAAAVPMASALSGLNAMFPSNTAVSGHDGAGQTSDKVCAAEPPPAEDAPRISFPPGSPANNLKRIKGIDGETEATLNSLGLTTYWQMTAMSCSDIVRVNAVLGSPGRIERENWVSQARILADGGSTAHSREVDQQDANKPPALSLVASGKFWCLNVEHEVAVKIESHGRTIDSSSMEAGARPAWEADVAKKYGPDWTTWTGHTSIGCFGDDCTVSAKVCKPRTLDCKTESREVGYTYELPPGLSPEAKGSIAARVQADLRSKWDSDVRTELGTEWITSDDIASFDRPIDQSCIEEALEGDRTRYQCKFATAACKNAAPPAVPVPASASTPESPAGTSGRAP